MVVAIREKCPKLLSLYNHNLKESTNSTYISEYHVQRKSIKLFSSFH